ncbi:MAG: alpha-N-arabinofuranosidase [Planctomycetota bacterium]|nr:alpha-N-arabinofuranosidase [Planctomycetota bacterium]
MKRRDFLKVVGALSAVPSSLVSAAEEAPTQSQAIVTINTDAPSKPYSPMIFGGFLEHFDNQIYGGVFEPGSPLADKQGFRTDVIGALKEMKVPVIRWPGGCFVDSYHWRNGVGRQRQPHADFIWGVMDPNTFGTHEFVEFCRRLGAEPYICQNGVAKPQENVDWVNYCNATNGPLAEMRKANGHPEPLNVKFWSVGNERYDKAHSDRVRDNARAMKNADPTLQITCPFHPGGMRGIASYLLDGSGKHLDYVSIHEYWLDRGDPLPQYDYMTAISKSEMPEAYMRKGIDSLAKAGHSRLKIAFDEWNLRAWQHPGFPRGAVADYEAPEVRALVEKRRRDNDLASQYTLADALFSASFLNACLRHAGQVTMANIAPLVNTRGPLFVHPGGIVKRTHFHAMAMYANLLKECVAGVKVDSERLVHGDQSVAVVDALATVDKSGKRWAIALVNRHPSKSLACTVMMKDTRLDGTFKATVLAGESADAYNDIEHLDRVVPKEEQLTFKNGIANLPPHSLTIVRVSVE